MDKIYKYRAFISYAHKDKTFAKWLHKRIENYKIPKGLRAKYPHLPKDLKRSIFRDEEELPTSSVLGDHLKYALENSKKLIVICSPDAVASKWVNEEIHYFKKVHGEFSVLAILKSGEPKASTSSIYDSSQEAFPKSLLYTVGKNGKLTDKETEPLAGDARSYWGREMALMKMIAGILEVDFADLWVREKKESWKKKTYLVVLSGLVLSSAHYVYRVNTNNVMLNQEIENSEKEKENYLKEVFSYLQGINEVDLNKSESVERLSRSEQREIVGFVNVNKVKNTEGEETNISKVSTDTLINSKTSTEEVEIVEKKKRTLNQIEDSIIYDREQLARNLNASFEYYYRRILRESYRELIEYYQNEGDKIGEILTLIKVIELSSEDREQNDKLAKNYFYLGDLYTEIQEYESAIEAYAKVLEYANLKKSEFQKIAAISFYSLYELSLIYNITVKSEIESKFIKDFQYEGKFFIVYEMLKLFNDVFKQKSNVLYGWEGIMNDWEIKYEDISLDQWDLSRLAEWVENLEDDEEGTKESLNEMLNIFMEHGEGV